MNAHTLHYARRIRSSFGIVKVPFTLAAPLKRTDCLLFTGNDLEQEIVEPERYLAAVLKKLAPVKCVKLCTSTTGWVHFTKDPRNS